jgi:peptide/nickel transport system permease protein
MLHSVVLLTAVSLFGFVFLNLAPGDFFDESRLNPSAHPETAEALRVRYGLSQPLVIRYWMWLRSAARGDFGESLAYQMPVRALVGPRWRNTALLTLGALLVAWGTALPLGVWSAAGRGRWLDRMCSLGGTSLLAVPDLLLATLLLLIAARTGWLPVGGSGGTSHVVLPVVCLSAGLFPVLFRHVRASVMEASGAPFARTARGLGIPSQRLLFFHILPAAANPVISLFGLSLGGVFSASLLVEVIFGWPGLGPLFLEAIAARDTYLVLAIVLLSAAMLVTANLLADILLYAADPRIRREA